MEKLTLNQLFKAVSEHNEKHGIKQQFEDKHPIIGVIVFSQKNWPGKDFSLECRSYAFYSDNKYFLPDMHGNSLYASALDGSDNGVRLDYYLRDWKYIDYCYIKED